MFEAFEKSSSPYINRFLSADTIAPNPSNPQNLNRFSYVTNNPLRYTDPTGHMQDDGCRVGCGGGHPIPLPSPDNDEEDGGGSSGSGADYCLTHPGACAGGGEIPSPVQNQSPPPPVDGYYCQASTLTCWANFTQDMATTVDSLFAGLEIVLVVGGCASGGVAGCGVGGLTSWEIFNMGPNQLESALSGLSLVLTAVEDYSADQQLGESTATSFTTFVLGGMSPDPVADVIIDGYASGYNHGFFNGIFTLMNGGPFLQNPAIYK